MYRYACTDIQNTKCNYYTYTDKNTISDIKYIYTDIYIAYTWIYTHLTMTKTKDLSEFTVNTRREKF